MQEKLINKELYKKVKKMNRKQMKEYLENIYKNGFRAGAESGDNADFRIRLSQVLNKTKGVGMVLYDRIMEN